MKLLKTLLSLSLILTTLTSTASEKILNDTILSQSDIAPFSGVLVPEDHYREFSKALKISRELKDAPKCQECQPCNNECGIYDKSLFFFGGFSVGLTGAILLAVLKH